MAPPTEIMIVRHAEKPDTKGQPPFGVNSNGVQDWESLIIQGWQRAGALVVLFDPARGSLQDSRLVVPTLIYAANPTTARSVPIDSDGKHDGSKSQRPLETITPLAAKLGLTPNLSFAKGDEKKLADNVLTQSGVVLIAWQHQDIPKIADHLVKSSATTNPIPQTWPGDRFDLVWVFTPPASSTAPWGFDQVPQLLLAGDENSIISP
jgi:hypothetical protein